MRKEHIYSIMLSLLLSFVIIGSIKAQTPTVSEYALIRTKILVTPELWEINKSYTNSEWGINLFNNPKAGVFPFDMDANFNVRSSLTAVLDPSWNRLVYSEMEKDFIKSYGSFGNSSCQLKWPQNIEALSLSDQDNTTGTYDIYIADTYNDRISRATYIVSNEQVVCGTPITGNGLSRPIDVTIEDNGTFLINTDDRLWVLNGDNNMLRFRNDGTLMTIVEPPQGCKASSIAYSRHGNNLYLADTANSKIYLYRICTDDDGILCNPGEYVISGEVPITSSIVDLEIDWFGNVWALDQVNGTITKYDKYLTPLCVVGIPGGAVNQFAYPSDMSNPSGYWGAGAMFISEAWSNTTGIQRYTMGTDILEHYVWHYNYNGIHFVNFLLIDNSSIEVDILAQNGQPIKSLASYTASAGEKQFIWYGKNEDGEYVPSGDYTYRIKATSLYYGVETGTPVNEVVRTGMFFHDFPDIDLDGIANAIDNCIFISNPTQEDTDLDGVGNACDNCPLTSNPNQYDNDHDGMGNACDCCLFDRGNIDGIPEEYVNPDGSIVASIDISDLVYMIDAMFTGGPDYPCLEEANVNGSSETTTIDISDLVYLVDFMFTDGPPPVACPSGTTEPAPFVIEGSFLNSIIIGPLPIDPPLELTTLTTNYANGYTTITLDAVNQLKGLEFYIQSVTEITPTNLMTGTLDFLYEYSDSNLHVGILDLSGALLISSGTQNIVKIPGNYQISSALAVDESSITLNVTIQ